MVLQKKNSRRGSFRYFVKEVCHENPRLLGRDIQGSRPEDLKIAWIIARIAIHCRPGEGQELTHD
jgi:hypothetical protein